MILSVRINNYKVYSREVELKLYTDKNVGEFEGNVYNDGTFRALKSACIFGANNSGKTCIVKAIKCIQNVLLNKNFEIQQNFFTENNVTYLGVSFLRNGRAFSYDFKYDATPVVPNMVRGFIYERMAELHADVNGILRDTGEEIFVRDEEKGIYRFSGGSIPEDRMRNLYSGNILIYSATKDHEAVAPYTAILTDFANNLDIIRLDSVRVDKTSDAMRDKSPLSDKIVELIKNADLDMDDFVFNDAQNGRVNILADDGEFGNGTEEYFEKKVLPLHSVHHGKEFPSVVIDSDGTAKIIAVSSYIVDALENGKTLIIDGIDSGLHCMIVRSLVLLFNNGANDKGGQLIFCTHDMTLMDCERLFRQDQIWFVCKEKKKEYLYRLSDLGYADEEVSFGFNLTEKYRMGELGPTPNPDFLSVILDGYNCLE
ncbi:MAG: ATP-binding protein [Clostridia bacterium]|nr:ATP-binding protein [Clostridia bacterium]